MTRKFWAALIGIFFCISIASAIYLFMSVKKKSVKVVPLRQVVSEMPKPEKPPDPPVQQPAVDVSTEPLKPNEPETPKTEQKKDKKKSEKTTVKKAEANRNIAFSYHNSKAKEVFIIGDFNNWTKQPFSKKAKGWGVAVKLQPGSHEYQFIVDGKKIPDPNNKRISKEGKSILTVKPLGSK